MIILTGGKTLGHVTPLISIAKHINDDLVYIGQKGSMEEKEANKNNIAFFSIKAYPLSINPLKFLRMLFYLFKEAIRIRLKFMHVDKIYSSGGFVSASAILAFSKKKTVKILLEPNTTLGIANKVFLPFVTHLYTGFPTINHKKAIYTGMPLIIAKTSFDDPWLYMKGEKIL